MIIRTNFIGGISKGTFVNGHFNCFSNHLFFDPSCLSFLFKWLKL